MADDHTTRAAAVVSLVLTMAVLSGCSQDHGARDSGRLFSRTRTQSVSREPTPEEIKRRQADEELSKNIQESKDTLLRNLRHWNAHFEGETRQDVAWIQLTERTSILVSEGKHTPEDGFDRFEGGVLILSINADNGGVLSLSETAYFSPDRGMVLARGKVASFVRWTKTDTYLAQTGEVLLVHDGEGGRPGGRDPLIILQGIDSDEENFLREIPNILDRLPPDTLFHP